MSTDIKAMFDVSELTFTTEEKQGNENTFYPAPDKGTGNRYQAVIRFIPWWEDLPNSIITKYAAYLIDPVTGDKRTVWSYKSIGKEKECRIVQTFFKLFYEKDVRLKKHDRMFTQKERHTGIIQILQDKSHPENEGKLKIWSFGYKVKSLFDAEEKPSIGKGRKPLDLFEGRPFSIDIYESGKQPQYDTCKFLSPDDIPEIPMYYGENKKPLDIKNSEADLTEYLTFLKEHSPSLESYKFKEWDKETSDYVDDVITHVYGGQTNERIQSEMTITSSDDIDSKSKPKTKSKKADINDDIASDLSKSNKVQQERASAQETVEENEDFDDENFDFDDEDFDFED